MNRSIPPIRINMVMNVVLTASAIVFPIITLPYVTRVLGPEHLGKVYFGNSVITLFSMLAELGIPIYGIKACAKVRDDKEELSRTVREILTINLIACLVSYVLLGLSVVLVPKLAEERILIMAMCGVILLNSLGMEWLYKALEKYAYITIRSVALRIIVLIAVFVIIKTSDDYILYGALTVAVSSASNIINMLYARKQINLGISGPYNYRRHIPGLMVLFVMSLAVNIYTNADLAILDFICGDAQAGVYGVSVRIKTALVSLITAVGAVLLPRLAYYYEKGKLEEFIRLLSKTMSAVLFISATTAVYFIVFADEIIETLAGKDFKEAVIPTRILMLAMVIIVVSNIIGLQMLVPMNREKKVACAAVLGAIVDLSLNFILTPQLESAGAAAASLTAELCVMFLLLTAIGKETAKELFKDIHTIRIALTICAALTASVWVKPLVDSPIASLVISVLCYSVVCCISFCHWRRNDLLHRD